MKVIAVDFDGTLTNGGYLIKEEEVEAGTHYDETTLPMKLNPSMRNFLEEEHDTPGGCFIVVYTARPHSHHGFLYRWLTQHGVPFDAIVCGKIRADMYIDDKAFTPEDIENGKNCTVV